MLGLSGKRVAASSFQQTVHRASLDYQPLEQPKPVNCIASAAPRRGNEDKRKRWTDALTLVLKGSHCRSAGNQALFLTPWGTGCVRELREISTGNVSLCQALGLLEEDPFREFQGGLLAAEVGRCIFGTIGVSELGSRTEINLEHQEVRACRFHTYLC